MAEWRVEMECERGDDSCTVCVGSVVGQCVLLLLLL